MTAAVAHCGAVLAILVALAAGSRPGPGGTEPDGDRVDVRELVRDAQGGGGPAPSAARRLSGPAADFRGPPGWRPLVGDRSSARRDSLAGRAARRAYDGAPPVMPHSRYFARTKSCLDCHADGIRLGERFGPPVSHPHLASCMQCHVESRNLEVPPTGAPVENTFAGRGAPVGGTRAGAGAPPVLPHATLMRTDCLSCHGPNGYPGLRTDHPQRSNCVQCHAVAASLDQTSPFFTGVPTLTLSP